MATIGKNNPCPECGYPSGVGCRACFPEVGKEIDEITEKISKKRGPKPRPGNHKSEPMRVPACLHKHVRKIIKEWKREQGYV